MACSFEHSGRGREKSTFKHSESLIPSVIFPLSSFRERMELTEADFEVSLGGSNDCIPTGGGTDAHR